MNNVAYTKDYSRYRREQEVIFCEDYLQDEETVQLDPRYQWVKRSYSGKIGQYSLYATENELLDDTGGVLYVWRNLNDGGEFCKIMTHSNGSDYLIFRTDLYGYSVLNLMTLQDFHYIPSGSFPTGETFIWTDVFYNPKNNIIAVSGCYWACPSGMLLLDFSSPMEEPGTWVDLFENLKGGYDRYDEINFAAWRGTDLALSAVDSCTETAVSIVLIEEQYIGWLKKVRL